MTRVPDDRPTDELSPTDEGSLTDVVVILRRPGRLADLRGRNADENATTFTKLYALRRGPIG